MATNKSQFVKISEHEWVAKADIAGIRTFVSVGSRSLLMNIRLASTGKEITVNPYFMSNIEELL